MEFLKGLIPKNSLKFIRPYYHGCAALLASFYYGRPSGSLVVIGITGTAGKSTTAAILSHVLNQSGLPAGYMTTVNFFDGKNDFINKHGLSMPGGCLLQKQLRQILNNGCKYAIVECTSEGLAQNRHLGIKFYMGLFTNLSEAHLQAHGGFENYKKAKSKLFQAVKVIGANLDDKNADYFLSFPAENKFGVDFESRTSSQTQKIYQAVKNDLGFELERQNFEVKLPGEFNKYNALMAASTANILGVDLIVASKALSSFTGIRGRMEPVANNRGIKIFVDYGCEPASFNAALKAAAALPHNKLIHVFGSTGGHRDTSKRFQFGNTSAQFADSIIITNDDVYDSGPEEIARNIEAGIINYGSRKPQHEIILDRKQAIAQALLTAQPGDLVLITGKGSEQFLVLPGNKRVEWDEVKVVEQILTSLA